MATLASRLGQTILTKSKETVSDFGKGLKGAFISANPAVFGPAVAYAEKRLLGSDKKKASDDAAKKDRKEKEKEQRQQGFMEENFMEDRRLATDTLNNIVGINKNTASIDRTAKEILELLKKCCACKCDEGFMPRLPRLPSLPIPIPTPSPGTPRLPGPSPIGGGLALPIPVPPIVAPGPGTTPGARPDTPTVSNAPYISIPTIPVDPMTIQNSIMNGILPIFDVIRPTVGALNENLGRVNYGAYTLNENLGRTNFELNATNERISRLGTSLNQNIDSSFRLSSALESGIESSRRLGSVAENAGRVSYSLADAAERIPKLPSAIESVAIEFEKIRNVTSQSTLRIAQQVDIFGEQLNRIVQNARVPISVGGEVASELYRMGAGSESAGRISGGAPSEGLRLPVTPSSAFIPPPSIGGEIPRLGSSPLLLGYGGPTTAGASPRLGGGGPPLLGYSEPIRFDFGEGRVPYRGPGIGPGPVTDIFPMSERFKYGMSKVGPAIGTGLNWAAGPLSAYAGYQFSQSDQFIAQALGKRPEDITTADRVKVFGTGTVTSYALGLPEMLTLPGEALRYGAENIFGLSPEVANLVAPSWLPRFGEMTTAATSALVGLRPGSLAPSVLDRPGKAESEFPSYLNRPSNLPKGVPTVLREPEFMGEVDRVASNLGISSRTLLEVMAFESRLNPQAVNPKSGATGLIQFTKDTAESLGTSLDALGRMSATEQLKYVEEYYKRAGLQPGSDVGTLYLRTFFPAAANVPESQAYIRKLGVEGGTDVVGKTAKGTSITSGQVYDQNRVFDPNKKGYFTIGDVKDYATSQADRVLNSVISKTGFSINDPAPRYPLLSGQQNYYPGSLLQPFGAADYSLAGPPSSRGFGSDQETRDIPKNIDNISNDIYDVSGGVTELLDLTKQQTQVDYDNGRSWENGIGEFVSIQKDTRKTEIERYIEERRRYDEMVKHYNEYRKIEDEKARRLEGYENERKRLQNQFDSQMQGIFRPMVEALKGPAGTYGPESMLNAGRNLSKFLRDDFQKLGVTIFGKQYGAAIGGTFQELAGVYMNQFITESLAPMLGMNSGILNRAINTYAKGIELIDPQLKQVNASLAKSREALDKYIKQNKDITTADLVTAAGRGGFTPEQKQKIAELTALRRDVAQKEAAQAALKNQKNQYKESALEDLIFGMTGISLGPRTMLDQYAGGAEGLTKDLASFFGAPFNPLFGLSDKDAVSYQKLQAESKLNQSNVYAIAKVNENNLAATRELYQKEIIPGMRDAVSQGISDKGSMRDAVEGGVADALGRTRRMVGGGTSIPGFVSAGANLDEYGIPIQGDSNFYGEKVGRGATQNRLIDFGTNLLINSVGSRVSKAFGGGIGGTMIGKFVGGAAGGMLRGQSIVQSIGNQFGIKLEKGATFSDLASSLNQAFGSVATGLGGAISSFGSFVGSGKLAEFGAGMKAGGMGASAGQMQAGSAAQYGAYAGQAAGMLGGYMAGRPIGQAISGGFGIGGGSGNSAINVGAAIGSFFGPLGTFAGAILGGVANRLFGSKTSVIGQGLTGTISGSGTDVSSYVEKQKEYGSIIGLFKDDKRWRELTGVDSETKKAFDGVTKGIVSSTEEMLKAIGTISTNLAEVQYNLDVKFEASDTEEQKMQKISDAFTNYQRRLIDSGNAFIKLFSRTGEQIEVTTTRLANAMIGAKPILDALGYFGPNGALKFFALDRMRSGQDLSALVANRLSDLQDAFGGIEAFQTEMSTLIGKMFTPEEQAKINLVNLNEKFKEFTASFGGAGGISLPSSIPDNVEQANTIAKTKFAELRNKLVTGEITPTQYRDGIRALNAFIATAEQKSVLTKEASVPIDWEKLFPKVDEYGNVIQSATSPIVQASQDALAEAYSFVDSITSIADSTRARAEGGAAGEIAGRAIASQSADLINQSRTRVDEVTAGIPDIGGGGGGGAGGSGLNLDFGNQGSNGFEGAAAGAVSETAIDMGLAMMALSENLGVFGGLTGLALGALGGAIVDAQIDAISAQMDAIASINAAGLVATVNANGSVSITSPANMGPSNQDSSITGTGGNIADQSTGGSTVGTDALGPGGTGGAASGYAAADGVGSSGFGAGGLAGGGGGSVDAAGNQGLGGSEAGGLGDAGGLSGGGVGSGSADLAAEGGYFSPSKPVVIGEVGPEIFVPHTAGTVIPTHRIIEAVQNATSLDTQTRNLLEMATPKTNTIGNYYLQEEAQRLRNMNNSVSEGPQMNSAFVDNSVKSISNPQTTIVNRGDHVRDNHPVMGMFSRGITTARI